MWPTSEVETALLRGYEVRDVEIKGPCHPDDTHEFGRIVRALLAMSNNRDGGKVVVGIAETSITAMEPGLTEEQAAGWVDHDRVRDLIGKYADPPLSVESTPHRLRSGATAVVLEVPGIGGTPHFCVKQLQTPDNKGLVLRNGALYVRTIHKPQSVEVSGIAEMSEVLDAAVTARLREFVQTAHDAGLTLGIAQAKAQPSSAHDAYEEQRRGAWSNHG